MSQLHNQMREQSQLELSRPLSKDQSYRDALELTTVPTEIKQRAAHHVKRESQEIYQMHGIDQRKSSREILPEALAGSNMQTAEFNNSISQRAPTFSPVEKSNRLYQDSRQTQETERLLRQAAQKPMKSGIIIEEQPISRQTIENDNRAANMLIMNEDLPLAETYPFNTNVVANALEPHMIKEAAFSDTEHTPLRDRLEASFKGYQKSNYTAMDQDKR